MNPRAPESPMSSASSASPASSPSFASSDLTRREALKRAATLLGVAISPSILAGVLRAQAAPASRSASAGASGKPTHLTPKQFEAVAAIAERILPRTDTPGAQDVGVPAFVDLMYGEYMTDDEKRVFVAGLAEIDAVAAKQHRREFMKLSAAEQETALRRIAEASQKKEKTFFHLMKELTIVGYFTSEPVGKTVLKYDPIPGRYDPCIPLSEVGNVSWTR